MMLISSIVFSLNLYFAWVSSWLAIEPNCQGMTRAKDTEKGVIHEVDWVLALLCAMTLSSLFSMIFEVKMAKNAEHPIFKSSRPGALQLNPEITQNENLTCTCGLRFVFLKRTRSGPRSPNRAFIRDEQALHAKAVYRYSVTDYCSEFPVPLTQSHTRDRIQHIVKSIQCAYVKLYRIVNQLYLSSSWKSESSNYQRYAHLALSMSHMSRLSASNRLRAPHLSTPSCSTGKKIPCCGKETFDGLWVNASKVLRFHHATLAHMVNSGSSVPGNGPESQRAYHGVTLLKVLTEGTKRNNANLISIDVDKLTRNQNYKSPGQEQLKGTPAHEHAHRCISDKQSAR